MSIDNKAPSKKFYDKLNEVVELEQKVEKIILFSSLELIVLCIIHINDTFAQIEVPTQFSTFQSDEYGIQMDYPSNWQKFGDFEPGDYINQIAIFAPNEEMKFKEFNSLKDLYKFDTRALIEYDYTFVIPKLNLPFALDNQINTIKNVGSGFKGFKIVDSTTKSELGGKPAYQFTYLVGRKGDHFKYLDIGTIINEN